MQPRETPGQAVIYWKTHIATHRYFNSECECLVVFILNTRRRIKGHYLVSIGTMDKILCHPRVVFRLAILASAAAIICSLGLLLCERLTGTLCAVLVQVFSASTT
jgi:DNA repair protein RadC